MTELILNYSLSDSRELVVNAFKQTEGIKKYQKSDHQVVGKTGVSVPRVLWSYGESVYVDLSETGESGKTKVDVRAEKEIWTNIGGNPEKFKRRFLDKLSKLRQEDDPWTGEPENGKEPIPTVKTERESSTTVRESENTDSTTTSGKVEISSISVSDDYSESEINAAKAIIAHFNPGELVIRRELKKKLFSDYPAGHNSKDEWWSKFTRPLLDAHPNIDQADQSGIRWSYTNEQDVGGAGEAEGSDGKLNERGNTYEVVDEGLSEGWKILLIFLIASPLLTLLFIALSLS